MLVVDDDTRVRAVTEAFLLADGHEVHTAADAEEALALFRTRHFDVVVTDHAMPGASGEQLAAQLKAARADVPVVLLTGFGDLMEATGQHPVGVDRLLAKPTTRRALGDAVVALTTGPTWSTPEPGETGKTGKTGKTRKTGETARPLPQGP